jgi:hypothetical protein
MPFPKSFVLVLFLSNPTTLGYIPSCPYLWTNTSTILTYFSNNWPSLKCLLTHLLFNRPTTIMMPLTIVESITICMMLIFAYPPPPIYKPPRLWYHQWQMKVLCVHCVTPLSSFILVKPSFYPFMKIYENTFM